MTEATQLRVAYRDPLDIDPAPLPRVVGVPLRFRPIGGRMDRAAGIAV